MSAASRPRKIAWIARLGTLALRLLAGTWRVHWANADVAAAARAGGRTIIYVLWHGNLLPMLWAHRGRDIAVIISEHGDGEIITRVARSLGFRAVRGSTSRGAARALLGACRELDSGHDLAITPDGPRGPAGTVAPGAVVIAQRTGAPMLPVAAHAERAWRLKSWDRFQIPKPFSRVTIAYDTPILVSADSPRDATLEMEKLRAGIDRAGETAATQ